MYRYLYMRIIISFTCLFLIAACHNKNDLKRIDDLEKENKIISDSLIQQNKIIKLVYDSLVEKQANPLIICGIGFRERFVISQPKQSYIPINSDYKSQVLFVENLFATYSLNYSIPTKERNFKKATSHNSPLCNKPLQEPDYFTINFTPKDTGWYFWNGEINVRNDRTGMVTTYPIIDSFYVYK